MGTVSVRLCLWGMSPRHCSVLNSLSHQILSPAAGAGCHRPYQPWFALTWGSLSLTPTVARASSQDIAHELPTLRSHPWVLGAAVGQESRTPQKLTAQLSVTPGRSFTWCQVFPAQEQAPQASGPLLPELPAQYLVGKPAAPATGPRVRPHPGPGVTHWGKEVGLGLGVKGRGQALSAGASAQTRGPGSCAQ